MLNSCTLFIAQLAAHTAFLFLVFSGSLWEWSVVLLVYFFTGCVGMTATYHRLLSHGSWKCLKVIEYFGVLCATIGLTGSAVSWVAVHRKHHLFADSEKDPHSPDFKGFFYCHWLSMFEKVEVRYVTDLLKKSFYVFQHKYYFHINLVYAFFLFMIDNRALLYAWLVPSCLLWNAGSSIVTLSHLYGSNPHKLKSKAKNFWPLALLVWGEGWHNNHHASPGKSNFSEKFYQIDIGFWYIYLATCFSRMFNNLFRTLKLKTNPDV